MIKIIGPRATGKTRKLVEIASSNDGIIVCKNPERMLEKAHLYGLSIKDAISYEDFVEQMYCGTYKNENVYMDDVDEFLTMLRIKGFTLVEEEE